MFTILCKTGPWQKSKWEKSIPVILGAYEVWSEVDTGASPTLMHTFSQQRPATNLQYHTGIRICRSTTGKIRESLLSELIATFRPKIFAWDSCRKVGTKDLKNVVTDTTNLTLSVYCQKSTKREKIPTVFQMQNSDPQTENCPPNSS